MKNLQTGRAPVPLERPFIHILIPHVGLRSPDETLFPCLERVICCTLPHKFWFVLQIPDKSTVDRLREKMAGHDHEIIIQSPNKGTAWPKARVMPEVALGEYFVIVDDDIMVPSDAIEQMWALHASTDWNVITYDCGQVRGHIQIQDNTLKCIPDNTQGWTTTIDRTGFGLSLMGPEVLKRCQFDDQFFIAEDLDFCLQLREASLTIGAYIGDRAQHLLIRPHEYRRERMSPDTIEQMRQRYEQKWNITFEKWPL